MVPNQEAEEENTQPVYVMPPVHGELQITPGSVVRIVHDASAGIGITVFFKDTPDDVFVDCYTKDIGNLLGNSWEAEAWIAALYLDDGLDKILGWLFEPRLAATAKCVKQMIFSHDENSVKSE